MEGQMMLALFDDGEVHRVDVHEADGASEWLIRRRGCTEAVRPHVEALFDAFDAPDAFERCKALDSLDGLHRADGWCLDDADALGLWDEPDYHTVWDREWAAKKGYVKAEVARISEWDYRENGPKFMEEQ